MWTTQARQRYAWTRRKEGLRFTNAEWALIEPLLPPRGVGQGDIEHESNPRPLPA